MDKEKIDMLNDENAEGVATEYAAKTLDSETTCVKVLENLGPLLTSENLGKRKIGVKFLSHYLSKLEKGTLNETECQLFAKFYQDRLNDHHSLIPLIIRGILAIFQFENLKSADLCSNFRAFFTQIHTQSQVVSDRRCVFLIFEDLLKQRIEDIKPLGSEFVLAFVQSVDAEKDPVNMNIIFGMWPIVLTNFSLEPFEEDVFEAMSCYFPIDFSPPKGLEVLISKEDLVTGLRQCLSTSGIFAPLAMPLYMEKLDSDLNDAKVDANLTMIESMKKYSPEQVKPHLAELWGLLKKEILGIKMSVDDEVIGSCYLLIHQVTLTLSRALQSMDNREILEENWLNMVWQDIGRHLQDIELKFMSLTVDILVAIISTGQAFPSNFMLEKSMPILLHVYRNQQNSSKKIMILHYISRLLKDSADSGKKIPPWYEDFLYISCDALNETLELSQAGALALSNGSHFLKAENAETIFDQILKSSDHNELIVKCIRQSKGSRPTEENIQELFASKKGSTLAAIFQDLQLFQKYFEMVKSSLTDEFGIEMVKKVVQSHSEFPFNILKDLVQETIKTENPEKHSLLSAMSPKFDEHFSALLSETILKPENASGPLIKSLIAFAKPEVFNSISKESVKYIMDYEFLSEEIYHVQAALVNKIDHLDQILNLESVKNSEQLLWLSKGLIFRVRPYLKSKPWIDKILNSLEHGNDAIDFEVLIGEPMETFLHCPPSKAALARQKMFSITKPILIQAFQKDQSKASQHLKALICQLPYVPKFALSNEIATLLPLLIPILDEPPNQTNEKLILTSLTCLRDLLEQEPEKFAPFLSTVLPLWLKMAQEKERSMRVRIQALECIKMAAKADTKEIVPLKKDVIKGLIKPLDDHKRLVRQAAAIARNSWCIST